MRRSARRGPWLAAYGNAPPLRGKSELGDARAYFRFRRLVTFYRKSAWVAFPLEKYLYVRGAFQIPKRASQTRFAKPVVHLELAKGLEPPTL